MVVAYIYQFDPAEEGGVGKRKDAFPLTTTSEALIWLALELDERFGSGWKWNYFLEAYDKNFLFKLAWIDQGEDTHG